MAQLVVAQLVAVHVVVVVHVVAVDHTVAVGHTVDSEAFLETGGGHLERILNL